MSVSDPIVSFTGLVLGVDWSAPYVLSGRLEKLDVLPHSGSGLLQFRLVDAGQWTPVDGISLIQGVFQSLTGLAELFAAHGYVDAFRAKRLVAGTSATLDVRAYLI